MRKAKQQSSDERLAAAQRMASERSNSLLSDINTKTSNGTTRSIEADREMHRQNAMEGSILGRQGRIPENDKYMPSNAKGSTSLIVRDQTVVERSIVSKHRVQSNPGDHGNNSIPPALRKALKQNYEYVQKNDMQPRLHPQSTHKSSTKYAHGINNNPVKDAQKRKLLEARIREAANSPSYN